MLKLALYGGIHDSVVQVTSIGVCTCVDCRLRLSWAIRTKCVFWWKRQEVRTDYLPMYCSLICLWLCVTVLCICTGGMYICVYVHKHTQVSLDVNFLALSLALRPTAQMNFRAHAELAFLPNLYISPFMEENI